MATAETRWPSAAGLWRSWGSALQPQGEDLAQVRSDAAQIVHLRGAIGTRTKGDGEHKANKTSPLFRFGSKRQFTQGMAFPLSDSNEMNTDWGNSLLEVFYNSFTFSMLW